MSFPPADAAPADRTSGQGFVLGPDEGEAYWWLGSLTLNKVTRDATRGDMDIVDHRVPAGYSPPLHIHSAQDEVFYVIDGQFAAFREHFQAGYQPPDAEAAEQQRARRRPARTVAHTHAEEPADG